MEIKLSCPYGHTCERIVDEHIERCVKYIPMRGKDRNTGKDVDEWNCTEVWAVILGTENSQHTREVGAAVESFRNEMVAGNETMQRLFLSDSKLRLLSNDT